MRSTNTQPKATPGPEPGSTRSPWETWLLAGLLAVATLALYWPATQCDFLNCDDDLYVTENTQVQKGLTWENIEWAFTTPVSANWHPLTMMSHILDCQCYGLHPWGHHLTNILLHAINTALVFLVLRRLTGAFWKSALAAALFGWHPLHVESVAWVAERKDVLSCLFWLLSTWAYAQYAIEVKGQAAEVGDPKSKVGSRRSHLPSSIFYLLALFFFALGLLCKAMLVTLPCVLLLLDWWPLKRFALSDSRSPLSALRSPLLRRLVLEKIPFLVLALAACVVTYVVQNQSGAVMTVDRYPLDVRAANAVISYCRYLAKFFWPTDLAIYYPHPGSWPGEGVLLAAAFLAGVSYAFFRLRNREPFLLLGWLWFGGALVPVIGLVQVGGQAMADRYMYIPSLGLLVLVLWGAAALGRRWQRGMAALTVTGAAALVLCGVLTRQQLAYWKNSITIFRHAVAVTTDNGLALNNLGTALLWQGQTDEALGYLEESLRLRPTVAECHNNLANALLAEHRVGEAIFHSQEAIRLKPNFGRAHLILGNAYFDQGKVDQAIVEYQDAVRFEPGEATDLVNLGVALLNRNRFDEAMSDLQAAVRLKPDDNNAHYNLGVAFLKRGQAADAIRELQEALRLKPNDTDAQRDLAKARQLRDHEK